MLAILVGTTWMSYFPPLGRSSGAMDGGPCFTVAWPSELGWANEPEPTDLTATLRLCQPRTNECPGQPQGKPPRKDCKLTT